MQRTPDLRALLQQYWGYADFRPLQNEIITRAVAGQDVCAVLPTGGGKSLCYQLCALARGGVALVVTPLIALMHDQVQALQKRGIAAAYVTAQQIDAEIDATLVRATQKQLSLLYVSPERLQNKLFLSALKQMDVRLLAVDEAHCISQWGFDFRPAYRNIAALRPLLPGVPVMALTATATARVCADIAEQLAMPPNALLRGSVVRSNLRYVVLQEHDRIAKLQEMLSAVKGSVIIYVRSRATAAQLAQELARHGHGAAAYHAGMKAADRTQTQAEWMAGNLRIVVATTAFGMGIDKADVRMVVHWHLPPDLESYYQEAGRAGRDGKTGFCVLLYNENEAFALREVVAQRHPTLATIQKVYTTLCDACGITNTGDPSHETFGLDENTWSTQTSTSTEGLHACLRQLEAAGLIQVMGGEAVPARVQVLLPPNRLQDYTEQHPQFDAVLQGVLRQLGGTVFNNAQAIDLKQLAANAETLQTEVQRQLQLLHQLQVVRYWGGGAARIRFLQPRRALTPALLNMPLQDQLRTYAEQRLLALLQYSTQTKTCRSVQIAAYFDEKVQPCGVCDVCTGRHAHRDEQAQRVAIGKEVALRLRGQTLTFGELLGKLTVGTPELRAAVVRQMLQAGQLKMDAQFNLQLLAGS